MRKAAVRDGDPTTTRGSVIAQTSTIYDNGKKVALDGDEATCGNCSGSFKIIGTGKGISEKSRNVVIDGDVVTCPCGRNRVIIGGNPGIFLNSSSSQANIASTATPMVANPPRTGAESFDERFVLCDADGTV
ncbi:PAAR domain-containing protein, partial [Burkholderia pseudomallei]